MGLFGGGGGLFGGDPQWQISLGKMGDMSGSMDLGWKNPKRSLFGKDVTNFRQWLDPRQRGGLTGWMTNPLGQGLRQTLGRDNEITKAEEQLHDPAGWLKYNDPKARDKELEAEYLPRADREKRLAMQRATYGGTRGGLGEARSMDSYNEIIRMLEDEKQAFREQQAAKDQQTIGQIMSIIPFL